MEIELSDITLEFFKQNNCIEYSYIELFFLYKLLIVMTIEKR